MELGSVLTITWPWGIGKTCASNMIVYVQQPHSMDKDIQSDDIPRYPLAWCEDQILPLQKMLPALPPHFLFPIETEITI